MGVGISQPLADWFVPIGPGRRLVLATGPFALLWLGVGVMVLILLVALYRYERRVVSKRLGLSLLSIRLAVALALVAALLEPIGERVYRENLRGRVVLGVDLSESMATIDDHRSPEESPRLDSSDLQPIAGISRREVVRALLTSDWPRQLAEACDVEAVGFARTALSAVPIERLADRLAPSAEPGDGNSLATDWRGVLEHALADTSGAPIQAVVLLTDGRENGARTAERETLINRLAAREIPVHSVLIGSPNAPRDVAIAGVRLPDRLTKGDTADIRVAVKLDGEVPGSDVPVVLEIEGQPEQRKLARVPNDGTRPSVMFSVTFENVGVQSLALSLPTRQDDACPANDRCVVTVEVTDDTSRVLLIDGQARWEFRYLRNALIRDGHVEVDAIVLHQPPASGATESAYKTGLPEAVAGQPDPLGAFDLIVLGNVRSDDWPAQTWERLSRYVDHRGGTLVWSAGDATVDLYARVETARALLPIVEPRAAVFDHDAVDTEHLSQPPGARILPDVEAASDAWPMLRFAPEPERSRAVWDGLPTLPLVIHGRPKPAATALARVVGHDAEAAIAVLPFGLGQVMWVGTDATWRWRHRAGDIYHHRFWGQVVRWANANRLVAGNQFVRFGAMRRRYDEGQEIALQARFAENVPGLRADWLVVARVYRVTDSAGEAQPDNLDARSVPVAVVPLRPSARLPRVFEAVAPALPAGVYAVRLDAPQLAEVPLQSARFEVAPSATSELLELAATRDSLDRLASATGGRVVLGREAEQLLPLIQARLHSRTRVDSVSLWDRPVVLMILFGLLATEWLVRKRAGLP